MIKLHVRPSRLRDLSQWNRHNRHWKRVEAKSWSPDAWQIVFSTGAILNFRCHAQLENSPAVGDGRSGIPYFPRGGTLLYMTVHLPHLDRQQAIKATSFIIHFNRRFHVNFCSGDQRALRVRSRPKGVGSRHRLVLGVCSGVVIDWCEALNLRNKVGRRERPSLALYL